MRARIDHAELEAPLGAALQAARALPFIGWASRLADAEPGTLSPSETFLRLARTQVMARIARDAEPGGYANHECDLYPVGPGMPEAAEALGRALQRIAEPLKTVLHRLGALLEDEAEELEPAMRQRIEAARRSLKRRAVSRLDAWQSMLLAVAVPPPEPGRMPQHVHLLRLDRRGGADRDVGLHRHWLDPTIPFATTLAAPAHGLLVTSATLRDTGEGDMEASWVSAEGRVGAVHLPSPPVRVSVASPFDYARQTLAFVVTDVPPSDTAALAAALRALFLAAGGGGLGLGQHEVAASGHAAQPY